ncbi:MAG: glycosyltransferase [Candidatus Bathyarchaeia archaeon]
MRVIIFCWEFPPRVIGELGNYVKELAVQLAKSKVETNVVTYHDYLTGVAEEYGCVKTYRVNNPVKTHINIVTWALTLNQEIERVAANIYYRSQGEINLIDVHEWHFIPAAATLKKALGIPFIYSIESLEPHRSGGANMPLNIAIKSIEWIGTFEADKLVVKSEWMANEVVRIYGVPREKIKVVKPESGIWIKAVLKTYKSLSG